MEQLNRQARMGLVRLILFRIFRLQTVMIPILIGLSDPVEMSRIKQAGFLFFRHGRSSFYDKKPLPGLSRGDFEVEIMNPKNEYERIESNP